MIGEQPILRGRLATNCHNDLGEERGGDDERRLCEAEIRGVTGSAWCTGDHMRCRVLRASEMRRVHCALVERESGVYMRPPDSERESFGEGSKAGDWEERNIAGRFLRSALSVRRGTATSYSP